MPELPEVETVARDLRAAVVGRQIEKVYVLRGDVIRLPDPAALSALLAGQRIVSVGRRGKFLLLQMDSGDELITHLGLEYYD